MSIRRDPRAPIKLSPEEAEAFESFTQKGPQIILLYEEKNNLADTTKKRCGTIKIWNGPRWQDHGKRGSRV